MHSTRTVSSDPATASLIQRHVAQMQALLDACAARGGCPQAPLRSWDPLFAAVFRAAPGIKLQARRAWAAPPRALSRRY